MSKFKVGSTVRYVKDLAGTQQVFQIGHTYLVKQTKGDFIVCADTDDSQWLVDRFELVEEPPQERLYALAQKFIKEQSINCVDDIYQTGRVIENAYTFIHDVFNIVGERE